MKQSKLFNIVLILLSVILVGCAGSSSTPSTTELPSSSSGGKRLETRDLAPDPKAIDTGEMLFGVTGAPLEATAEAPFIEEDVQFRDHPLQIDVSLSEMAVKSVDLGDVLKISFTARSIVPSQSGSTLIELYVVVDDRLVGTARYPSTGYLEEISFGPAQVQPGDTFGVDSALYIGSKIWWCDDPNRVRKVEFITVLWNDSNRSHADGPWDGGSSEGLWSIYESIRNGASEPIEGVSRLNFKEESRHFIVDIPFFAAEDETDDGLHVAHAGTFNHIVDVVQHYWDYPVEPSELKLFPSDVAHITLHGFESNGLWVGGPTSTDLHPPLRIDDGVVTGIIEHTGADHLKVAKYDTLWWVSAFGQNTLFPDEANFAAQFIFDWIAEEIWIGNERLCNDEFNVSDVSENPPPTTTTTTTTTTTVYTVEIFVVTDPAGHSEFIGQMPSQLTVVVTGSVISISGENAFVSVDGELTDDETFVATGSGTVAGFSGTSVNFTGQLTEDGITGEYTMGGNGNLPTGQSITYSVQ